MRDSMSKFDGGNKDKKIPDHKQSKISIGRAESGERDTPLELTGKTNGLQQTTRYKSKNL